MNKEFALLLLFGIILLTLAFVIIAAQPSPLEMNIDELQTNCANSTTGDCKCDVLRDGFALPFPFNIFVPVVANVDNCY